MNSLRLWAIVAFVLFSGQSALIDNAHAKGELLPTLKEIFVKGSINNDKLFMVLGFEKASKIFKDSIKEAVDIEDLQDIGNDTARSARRYGDLIYNGAHDGDIIDHVGAAGKFTVENAPNIFKSPFKTLKKIPGHYKITMEGAREARANSSNSVLGVTKYAGLAVWANVKGAYYLVIEAPAKFVGHLAATALAVPATIAGAAIGIPLGFTIEMGFKAIRLGYQATKALVAGAVALGAIAYSGITTTIAAGGTLIAFGAMGAVKVVAYTVSLPFKGFRRAGIKVSTSVNYKKLRALADSYIKTMDQDELKNLGIDTDAEVTVKKMSDYKAKLVFKSAKTEKDALTLILLPKFDADKSKQNIDVEGYFTVKHFKAVKKEMGSSSKAAKVFLRTGLERSILSVSK
jgi:hypothetical protein